MTAAGPAALPAVYTADPDEALATNHPTLHANDRDELRAIWGKVGLSESSAADSPVADAALISVTNGKSKWGHPVLTTLEAALGADVALNNGSSFFDGPSVSLTAGTWFLEGSVSLTDTAGAAGVITKLWDGTTVEASAQTTLGSVAGLPQSVTLGGIVTVSTTTAWKISARDLTSTSGNIKAAAVSASQGNNASYLRAVRIK